MKPSKLNLENEIYQKKMFEMLRANIPNLFYSIKPTKLNQSNQYYRTKSRENKCTENEIKVQSQLELSLAQLVFEKFCLYFETRIIKTAKNDLTICNYSRL